MDVEDVRTFLGQLSLVDVVALDELLARAVELHTKVVRHRRTKLADIG